MDISDLSYQFSDIVVNEVVKYCELQEIWKVKFGKLYQDEKNILQQSGTILEKELCPFSAIGLYSCILL